MTEPFSKNSLSQRAQAEVGLFCTAVDAASILEGGGKDGHIIHCSKARHQ